MNLTPTTRIINGKIVSFYSPQQIESIVPPESRLPKSRQTKDSYYTIQSRVNKTSTNKDERY